MNLKHVSAEFFLAEVFSFTWAAEPDAVIKAEFQVNSEGKVGRFGTTADFLDMPDTMIWFERVP
jgi:hypothetical protein